MRLLLSTLIFLLLVPWLIVSGYSIKNRIEKDATGREWSLKNWRDGTRPYPVNLKEREKWYRQKRGEYWYGPQVAQRIYTPGNWSWEVYHSVPKYMAERLKGTGGGKYPWGFYHKIMTFVRAHGREVTDIYIVTRSSFYHYDALSKESRFIGNPEKDGHLDGVMDKALLNLLEKDVALDQVTGRLYFSQKIGNKKKFRFVEKLLPYRGSKTKTIFYLPSVLDIKKLYEKVESPAGGELKPLFKDGKRDEPVFVVRTNYSVEVYDLPGARRGRRFLITPDGKGIYYAKGRGSREGYWVYTLYNMTSLFDIETGKMIGRLNVTGIVPENFKGGDGPGTHGGNNVGYDGNIYTAQHGGAGGGPGKMFSINPRTGVVTILYDNMPVDRPWRKVRSSVFDGPADATSLWFTSTLWQTQCPRTGAIINGGWDGQGIRRYLDGFVTTIAGHFIGGFNQPARPGWNTGFKNVHHSSNPSVAPNGDLYIADVNNERLGKIIFTEPRIVRIYRSDWPKEQPVNGYAEKFIPKEKLESLRLEYAKKYIANFDENNRLLEEAGY
jgi:hypothetical protein